MMLINKQYLIRTYNYKYLVSSDGFSDRIIIVTELVIDLGTDLICK